MGYQVRATLRDGRSSVLCVSPKRSPDHESGSGLMGARGLDSKIAEDEEFILNSVTIFKKVKEDFAQKCRENK